MPQGNIFLAMAANKTEVGKNDENADLRLLRRNVSETVEDTT